MHSFNSVDCFKSFKAVEAQIDKAVKNGGLSKKEARLILEKARKSYREQNINKEMNKLGLLNAH
jgi:hypothetical protein